MALSPDHERRRALSRRNKVAKSGDQLYYDTFRDVRTKENVKTEENRGVMRKALCKRLANRQILVGSTAFSFDSYGICIMPSPYRITVIPDFETMLKMTGVTEIMVETSVSSPVPQVVEIPQDKVEMKVEKEVSSNEEINEEPDAPLMVETPKRKVGRPKKIKD